MKFNINDFPGMYAMYCPTESDAITFTQHLHSLGRKWNSGQSYKDMLHFYGDAFPTSGVVYYFNSGVHGRNIDPRYRTLNFNDFEWDEIEDLMPNEAEISMISSFLSGFCRERKDYERLIL